MTKKKILLLGSVPMALDELQMAPAMIGAFVKKRGHDFCYHDINLKLFEYCNKNNDTYISLTEFLQDRNNLNSSIDIIDTWQEFIVNQFLNIDILLINVFSVHSQITALRMIHLCRLHAPTVKIIMGGIGSHKKLLGGINDYNLSWAKEYFNFLDKEQFGAICLDNHLIDDWQPTVGLDVLEKWLPQRITTSYDLEVDFENYKIDQYQWGIQGKSVPMLGSHGCVRQCTFCDVIKHFPRYSFINADDLTKSIVKTYQQTGIYRVQFMDSLVNGSMSNFLKLLKNLTHARDQGWLPSDFSWSGSYICRPRNKILDEIHQNLASSGVETLVIGVESGSDRVRFEMEKKFTNADLLHELEEFRKTNVKAHGLFFPSWPTETSDDFQQTLELFSSLAKYGQCGTLDEVRLGTTGFALIDGTPIDLNKDKIGLHPGPVSWLWRCDTNPELTFWETVRRRLLMAEWCEIYGIPLGGFESTYRRYLSINLEQHRQTVIDYSGKLHDMIDINRYLPEKITHELKMTVLNNSEHTASIILSIGNQKKTYTCFPGPTQLTFKFDRLLSRQESLVLTTEFPNGHRPNWQVYDSGDYFDSRGLYLDQIYLDYRNITHWGWNQSVELSWLQPTNIPDDYYQHCNRRCLTSGMQLSMDMMEYFSPHKYLLAKLNPPLATEKSAVDQRLFSIIKSYV
jgi:hypothetical protein